MDTTIYLRFYLKKSKINRKGLTPVIMRITLERKRSEINIGRTELGIKIVEWVSVHPLICQSNQNEGLFQLRF